MGAGVAAGPHGPLRVNTKPGRRGSPLGGFEGHPSRGPGPLLRGPSGASRRLPVSPRAPRQGRSPGGSPLGRSRNRGSGSCLRRRRSRSSVPPSAGKPRPKPQPCLAAGEPKSAACRFAAPGPGPGPARRREGRNPVAAGGSAPTCVPLLPDRRRAETRACLFGRGPGGPKHWALHEACRFRIRSRASPQLPPGGGFVSRPGLRGTACCLVGQEGRAARAVAGKAFDRCRSIVSATGRKLSWNAIRSKALPAVDNEDYGHK
jgi:hypothetical protein